MAAVTPSGAMALNSAIVDRIVRLSRAVPNNVELGLHFCYGDAQHRHFKEPDDTAIIVKLANATAAELARPITWIHLPVPRNRSDPEYLAPLADLNPSSPIELYLGLVHLTDSIEGARRRIKTARHTLTREFGIATECGFGRRPDTDVARLLELHGAIVNQKSVS